MNKILIGAAAALFLHGVPAQAEVLQFTVTGSDSASFQLDTNSHFDVVTNGDSPPATYAIYSNLSGIFEGTSASLNVSFYDSLSGGGLDIVLPPDQTIHTASDISLGGDQLFTGTVYDPQFVLRTYTLQNLVTKADDVLTIADANAPSAVPEPSSWALMLVGFAAIGLAIRSAGRKRTWPRDAMTSGTCFLSS